jgi:formylglycine-generating enzyme required for sulfatase activity
MGDPSGEGRTRAGYLAALAVGGLALALSATGPAATATKSATQAPAPATIKDCSTCPEMVVLPAGEFTMGSPPTEKFRGIEAPHRVRIAAFAVSKFEITFAQWDACKADGGCNGQRPDDHGWGRGRQPVTEVSWNDARAYADWLSRKTAKHYRLLSEAEWEYAARGGAATPFAFGQTISARQANFDASSKTPLNPMGSKRGKALPVGSFAPNAFGLHDMHGNLWEWVEDCWNDEYGPNTPNDGKPALAGDCHGHVLRGGSWEDYAGDIRSAARVASEADDHSWSDGLRIARDL